MEICVVQVMDYGVALKFGSMHDLIVPQRRLFRVVLMLGNYQYRRGSLAQLCMQAHWLKHNHVLGQMLENDIACGNEECGEISFAGLSRCIQGDTLKYDIKHVRKLYRLLPVFTQCVSDVEDDLNISGGESGYVPIKKKCPEVISVTAGVKRIILHTKNGIACAYDPAILKIKGGVNLNQIISKKYLKKVQGVTKRYYVKDLKPAFDRAVSGLAKDINCYEGEQWDQYWQHLPAKPVVEDEDSDDQESSESVEESGEESPGVPESPQQGCNVSEWEWDESSGSDDEVAAEESSEEEEEEEEELPVFTVDKVTRMFKKKGVEYVTVKWKGHTRKTNEPRRNIEEDCPQAIAEYLAEKERARKLRAQRSRKRARADPAYKPSRG